MPQPAAEQQTPSTQLPLSHSRRRRTAGRGASCRTRRRCRRWPARSRRRRRRRRCRSCRCRRRCRTTASSAGCRRRRRRRCGAASPWCRRSGRRRRALGAGARSSWQPPAAVAEAGRSRRSPRPRRCTAPRDRPLPAAIGCAGAEVADQRARHAACRCRRSCSRRPAAQSPLSQSAGAGAGRAGRLEAARAVVADARGARSRRRQVQRRLAGGATPQRTGNRRWRAASTQAPAPSQVDAGVSVVPVRRAGGAPHGVPCA